MNKVLVNKEATKKPYISVSFINKDGTVIFLVIQEGSGDNLLNSDLEEGYMDYVDYSFVYSDDGVLNGSESGGMLLLKTYVSDLYQNNGLCDEAILDEIIKMEDFNPTSDLYIM